MKGNTLSMAIRGAILAAVGVTPAFAQEDTKAVDASKIDDGAIEQVTVTGSRIARPNSMSPTPVTTLTAEDISLSGETNLGDFLNELPALRSTFSGQNSGRFIGTVGLNLLDLRGLGTSRTLVLQDGRRHIASSVGTSAVDVNTIPEDLIERVDVITGGASAIYGADAVTGVVNFIMKDDFEGVKISAFASDTTNGGAETTEASFTFGQNFFDGRANVAGSVSLTSRGDVYGTDRDWITKGYGTLRNPNDTGPEDGIPDRFIVQNYTLPILSDAGIAWLPAPFGDYTFDEDGSARPVIPGDYCDSAGRCTGGDGYRWIGQYQMYPSMDTNNVYVKGHFDLNDSTRLFAEAKYVSHEAESWGQASFSYNGYSSTNPFLDKDLSDELVAAGIPAFGMYRMHSDLGYRGDLAERETQRYVVGVKGDIGSRWNYEASLVYGQYDADIFYLNNRHNERFAQAIDAIEVDGQIVCADADARAAGCQPLDLFGENQNSQEAIDWVMLDNTGSVEEMTQTVASGFIGGDLFDLPAGPLSVVGGFEYREETSFVDFDEIIKSGATFMNALATTDGEYDVSEAYVELSAPLLSDLPGVQSLVFDTAYRAADYSTIGSTGAWKAGLDWTVIDDVRVRATSSQAVRAPNIDELFAPLGQNFFNIDDPCDADEVAYAPNPTQRAANCAALGLAADYQSPWNEGPTLPGFSGGNENLQEETATTLTFGVVLTPRFAEGLTVTADYWDIEIEDAISYYGGQTILDKCVDASSIDNQFCGNIQRDANGDLVSLTSSALNASKLTARGIDYEVRYEMALADLFKSELGNLTLSLQGTRLLERDDYSFQNEPDSADRIDGELGDPTNAYNMNVTYRYGDLSVNWAHRYLDDMALYDIGLTQPESAAPSNTGVIRYNDLRAAYLYQDSFEVYGGINNIEDQDPPAYLSGTGGGSGMYDTLGRSFYMGVNYTF
ncbi:TonB-dependent receptor domain-containing protein [Microbulbifer sp. YPW1]|uniref:TonB-dependent receptor domain-containing protein n=1 Tax=Microbulbifer sp. YPW1 TaxID=2745199 RepID=UPI0015997FF4|nr:TonB-dependent receptor [Microbulbifer sp. YPW1]QKX16814.1 TonB-dependent receptor [Microbulbifer sp. YPW1]